MKRIIAILLTFAMIACCSVSFAAMTEDRDDDAPTDSDVGGDLPEGGDFDGPTDSGMGDDTPTDNGAGDDDGESDPDIVMAGDVNGDGVTNSDDAVAILRYLAGYDVKGNISLGDYDDNGKTNSDDAVAILRMLAEYED